VSSTIAVPDPPAKMMELTAQVAATQEEEPDVSLAPPDASQGTLRP
jgi:hypothetical protein